MKIKNIFFDMDGTIVESSKGIKNGFRYTFDKLGHAQLDDSILNTFIGPPLENTFMTLSHGDKAWAERAVATYRKYYENRGMREAKIYDGIIELLNVLRADDYRVYIATSKKDEVAKKMLDVLDLTDKFDGIFGSTTTENSKTLVLQKALLDTQSLPSNSSMVGDREHDIIGGFNNHVAKTIGVLWGFGNLAELSQAGATDIIQKPIDLLKVVKK
ncbi:phosphoglycolate phosphatase [Lactococcus hodotermopsidis]|uniref:Phosphoglycolate phosphatase n=1 Tax=Pseudolactococcus hodotermopsidis TaxID=2709157 RepID=A0A6A0BF78_9LACT|nr:HAD hydrolase-like protein [Lactococcus hodotermopsidis]GFH43355.1 phosphoglycolate phosphatase [Lactococcus hodotermopsidis]